MQNFWYWRKKWSYFKLGMLGQVDLQFLPFFNTMRIRKLNVKIKHDKSQQYVLQMSYKWKGKTNLALNKLNITLLLSQHHLLTVYSPMCVWCLLFISNGIHLNFSRLFKNVQNGIITQFVWCKNIEILHGLLSNKNILITTTTTKLGPPFPLQYAIFGRKRGVF